MHEMAAFVTCIYVVHVHVHSIFVLHVYTRIHLYYKRSIALKNESTKVQPSALWVACVRGFVKRHTHALMNV